MESYKHKYAKQILRSWLLNDFLRIELEHSFCLDGKFYFTPDLVCFSKDGICAIYEVVHRHELDAKKLSRMQFYFFISDTNIKIFEIQAEWIMRQIEKPKELQCIEFTTEYELF